VLKSYYEHPKHKYPVRNDLQELIQRLEEGMVVKGRILENLKNNKYLVRIWGYNIYTESETKLNEKDEVKFEIIQVSPHLILNPYQEKPKIEDHSTDTRTDIIVN
jgi:hypothetical protein